MAQGFTVTHTVGSPGPTGPQGPQGSPGIDGEEGVEGLPGATGPSGATGATGAAGATGASGAAGVPGLPGEEGPEGEPGSPGPAGATGATGAAGATGPTGATGAAGGLGPPGLDGIDGDDGRPGSTGPAGVAGATGSPGAAGAAGALGPPGFDGDDGLDGFMGLPGATGATGAAGANGTPGAMGPPGIDGEAGGDDALMLARLTAMGAGSMAALGSVDISGATQYRETTLTLVNGANNDVALSTATHFRITGPTAAFSITGIAGGTNGRVIYLLNVSIQILTLKHNDAGSVAANRLLLPLGLEFATSDFVGEPVTTIALIYSATQSRWVLLPSVAPRHALLGPSHYDASTIGGTPGTGELIYFDAGIGLWRSLSPNATATKKFLREISTTAPVWDTISYTDLTGTPPGSLSGLDGENGEDGWPGATGPAGAAGTAGAAGVAGSSGPPGLDGEDGLDGFMGLPGATGAVGAAGAPGANGTAGPMGPPGFDGEGAGEDSLTLLGPAGVVGTGTATRIAFWNSLTSLSSDAAFNVDPVNKRIGIGTSLPGTQLHIAGDGIQRTRIDAAGSDAATSTPRHQLRKSRNIISTPTAVVSGDTLGAFEFLGHDGTSYGNTSAALLAIAAETFSVAGHGSYLSFFTATIGTATGLERVRIDDDGELIALSGPARQFTLNNASAGRSSFVDSAHATNLDYTLPSSHAVGVLRNDGAGILSWTSADAFRGPPGVDGMDGENGERGAAGPQGAAGLANEALYLLLAGRTGSTNNPTISTDSAATLTGSGTASLPLTINACPGPNLTAVAFGSTFTKIASAATSAVLALPLTGFDFDQALQTFGALTVGKHATTGTSQVWTSSVDAVIQGGTLFWANPIIRSAPINTTRTSPNLIGLAFDPVYEIDANSGTPVFTVPLARAVRHIPTFRRNSTNGTVVATESTALFDQPTVGAGGTITTRRGLSFQSHSGAGAQGTAIAVDVLDQTVSTLAAATRSAITSGTGKWFLLNTGTAVSSILGAIAVGTASTVPNANLILDLEGALALRRGSDLAVGTGNDLTALAIGNRSFVRMTGPDSAFNLHGIANGVDGKVVILYNTSTFAMSIINDSATEGTAANRILTMTGATRAQTGTGNVTLIYDSSQSRWIVVSFEG